MRKKRTMLINTITARPVEENKIHLIKHMLIKVHKIKRTNAPTRISEERYFISVKHKPACHPSKGHDTEYQKRPYYNKVRNR